MAGTNCKVPRRRFLHDTAAGVAGTVLIPWTQLVGQSGRGTPSIRIDFDVEMKTRDGVILRSNITRPDIQSKVPAIVLRTPYGKTSAMNLNPLLTNLEAATAGFAHVVQDIRGRFSSEGEWREWGNDWGAVERSDGYDCIEWVASQPWCNGNVGMTGSSYLAGMQILAAKEQPPHLKAIAPSFWSGDYNAVMQSTMLLESVIIGWSAIVAYDLITKEIRRGEASQKDMEVIQKVMADPSAAANTLPLKDLPTMRIPGMPSYQEALRGIAKIGQDFTGDEERILVPVLITSGLWDRGGSQVYRALRARGGSALARKSSKWLLGPWGHGLVNQFLGVKGFGLSSSALGGHVSQDYLRFFSRHLRGEDLPELPNVRYFLMGSNVWKEAEDWPIPGTEVRPLYLQSRGRANTAGGDGTLSWKLATSGEKPDRYSYDPTAPVPSWGFRMYYSQGTTVSGPQEQTRVERRRDVLVYTSDPMRNVLEVVGDVELSLFISSSAVDTDFIVKLCDVDPDGISLNLADGFMRARFRNSWAKPELLKPGEIYELRIDLGPSAHAFLPGHRIRLQVTSSAFPYWDRNMNTGHPAGEDATGLVANQIIYHSTEHASRLLLPVQPRKG